MNSQVSSVSPGVVDANVKRESFSYGNMSDVQKNANRINARKPSTSKTGCGSTED